MFIQGNWNILVVDDEPDIHDVTTIALRRKNIFDRTVQLHHANSAAEGAALLADRTVGDNAALAFVDMIMESEQAGIELCAKVRRELKLSAVQLVLRTGQADQAPLRQAVDDFDILAFTSKVETSGDKLYVLVRSGIQHYYGRRMAAALAKWLEHMQGAASAKAAVDVFGSLLVGAGAGVNVGVEVGAHYFGTGSFADKAAFQTALSAVSAKEASVESPHWLKAVDDHYIGRTKILGSGHNATMLLHKSTLPAGLEAMSAPHLRAVVSYVGELLR